MVLSWARFIVSFAQSDLNRSETPSFLGVDLECSLGWETVSRLNALTQTNSSVILNYIEHINRPPMQPFLFLSRIFLFAGHTYESLRK